MQSEPGGKRAGATCARRSPTLLLAHNAPLHDLRREFGKRWEIAAITDGYRAVLRQADKRAPVALYGRTPAELAESIGMAEGLS